MDRVNVEVRTELLHSVSAIHPFWPILLCSMQRPEKDYSRSRTKNRSKN